MNKREKLIQKYVEDLKQKCKVNTFVPDNAMFNFN